MNQPEAAIAASSDQNNDMAGVSSGQADSQTSGWRKWTSPRRWPFWVCTALLLYTLGGFFLLPWLLERIATREVAKLDRTLNFGEIKANPFLLTLQLNGTELHDSDGALLFSYEEYFFNLQASSLFNRAWTFREIRLVGLQINAERFAPGDERFGRLIDAFPSTEEPEPGTGGSGLPPLIIQKLQVNDASMLLTDHLAHGKFDTALGPINVTATNLSTLPGQSGHQQATIKTRAGGEIAWQGNLQLSPLQSTGKVTVSGRLLSDLDHYLALFTSAKVTGEDLQWGFSYQVEQAADQSMTIRVKDFQADFDDWQLFLPDETEAFIKLPHLQISGADLQWPQQVLEIDRITLQKPELRLVAEVDGKLNLDRLLADLVVDEAAADSADSSAGDKDWQLRVARFAIEQAAVRYTDLSTEPAAEIVLRDINLAVSDVSNQAQASLPVQASFALASGGSGQFDGQAVVLPELSASGQFSLDALQLQVAQPWVNDIARVTLNAGSLDLNGQVVMNPQQPGTFKGSVAIAGLEVNDSRQQEKLTGWKQLSIDRAELDLAANSIRSSELVLSEPYGRLQIAADQSTNLEGLMIEAPGDEPAAGTETEPAAMAITVAGFKIDDASLDFSDLSLPLPFAAAIRKMDGSISTLATNSEEPARVDLEGQVNEYGLARIAGSLNAWDPTGFSDIKMTFRNLEMERMTPYTIEFAGWEIDAGRMDLDLDYRINQGQLKGDTAVVIRELTVGDKVESPSGASLPLKFAVALLKDSAGVIDVDLPVEGDLNDPSFKIGGILWQAIGNLLLKAVTAPFRLLGSLVGEDSEDFGKLHFAPGLAEISPPDHEQLLKLAEAMRLRPELRLEVAGSYSEDLDKPALQAQQAEQRIESAANDLPASAEGLLTEQRRQVMEQMLVASTAEDLSALQQQHSSIPAGEVPEKAAPVLDETAYLEALRQKLIAAEPVGEAELQTLAESRASAVIAALEGVEHGQSLPVTRLTAVAVAANENSEVALELKVEAAPE